MPNSPMPRQPGTLPLPQADLSIGDRFPNFALPDQTGAVRVFLERARGQRIIILVDADDDAMHKLAQLPCAAANTDAMAIMVGSEAEAAARASRTGAAFPILADGNGKIVMALRNMARCQEPGGFAVLLDPNQRLLSISANGDLHQWLNESLDQSPPIEPKRIAQVAPVLIIPNILQPDMCRSLIDLWETGGHEEGAVHSIVEGVEVKRTYHAMKRRRDHRIDDDAIAKPLTQIVGRRVAPEVEKAFAFSKFKFDRLIVTCYDSERGDYFRRHRDNLSPSTADRRFAMTINLNTPEYEGGELLFPEYGPERYSPPAGGAILFSCSLLHEALPVTKGRRFTLLSFLRA